MVNFLTAEQAKVYSDYAKLDIELAKNVKILYGGSMKPENAAGILSLPDVNGGLIGGASLKASAFLSIGKSICTL